MPESLRVVLADLSHVKTGTEWSVLPMPVNMGYLAAFASEYFSADVDIRICKAPADLIENVLTFEPHVVAFSNYIWNSNLSATAADWVRKVRPEALIVMGGPNLNSTELEGAAAFLRDRSAVDYYVPQEGEVPFLRILEAFEAKSRSRENLLPHALLGTWSLDSRREKIRETDLEVPMLTPPGGLDVRTGRLLDLNDIPSPFLTGVLDDFLRDPAYVPLIETNRGCPYSCTFCSWGDMAKSKSSSFPVERILKELDFLADNNHSRVSYLYIGDANFGLFPRDVEIAEKLRDLKESRGFPNHIYLYFAKNSSKRVVEIASLLRGMTSISLSRQTQNDDVLKNIKRKNIDVETFNSLSRHAKEIGVDSFAELIYGLPGESLQSFMQGVHDVLESDVDGLHFFPAMLLGGSEMATQESRTQYGLSGEFRAIDKASGEYGEFAATEYEEIVTSTDVFSKSDYYVVRRLHFVQSILVDAHAGGHVFYPIRGLAKGRSLFPLIQSLLETGASSGSQFGRLLEGFEEAARAEFLDADEIVEMRFAQDTSRQSLKLNPYFLSKLFYHESCLDEFFSLLDEKITSIYDQEPRLVAEVLSMVKQKIYRFDGQHLTSMTTALDPKRVAQAALTPKEVPLTLADLSDTVHEVSLYKHETYSEQLSKSSLNRQPFEAIYDVALHHSKENVGRMFTWTFRKPQTDLSKTRTISNEGGWLF